MKLILADQLTKQNMSIYELGKRVGLSYPTIFKIAKGQAVTINLRVLGRICYELACTPNDILIPEEDDAE